MCGIFCYISQNLERSAQVSNEWNGCKDLIYARGPDKVTEKVEHLTQSWFGHFNASILWMQGSNLYGQPTIDSIGNILLWNGDIFSGDLAQDNICDTDVVLNALQSSLNIMPVFKKIQGPYSFIYFQKSTNILYFGRDIIGRHSLLLKVNTDENALLLTSVASKEISGTIEVPAIGIFAVNLTNLRINLSCYPWKEPDLRFTDIIEMLETRLNVDINIRDTISEFNTSTHLHMHPNIKDIEYLENSPCFDSFYKTLEYLLKCRDTYERVDYLSHLLHKAVEVRIKKQPKFCKMCIQLVLNGEKIACDHAKVGILFSGGLDSAILALIADKYVVENEPIDLINVAFEKLVNTSKKSNENNVKRSVEEQYDVPDRKTGKQTFMELSKICPKRKWNFIEVNISQTELQKYRSSRICNLLYPLCTILDESLGCAVWFASRAKGTINGSANIYESPCRVLLLGMGADELFGGYMRHRTTLKHKGWDALAQELNIELSRISERNLGRDDRIVSDHGRQSRLPYLDENVVQYVQQLKPWERCYPTDKMPSGLGDKLLLRLVAYKLGFRNTANFPKRAFQFGSRIANNKENAKSISDRL
ncbi:asparagine synthetase domain-containing protein 1 [Megachile rotundata]|uniref:asparagine synthetase domain-containing protein 1 n=1 Tax=Megachile rotundata TaxID=143995 RepID=UPI000615224B|nr:PREDICTED: asparagine synthetase domain-containing protein 1 [Megachile rotundata]XP_012140961.1 PREDICTED: asparagine synthetase domain-containing protein 1 [Megachile rotundata]XP_012140962.1 PREDICTED: asparagine synthetase domain-containing protein 1 [Megachile rotundata]